MSDFENLLRRAKSGDSAAVETIYQMFRPLLVKNLKKMKKKMNI